MAGEMIQIEHLTVSNTSPSTLNFTSGVQKVYITAITHDMYVDFNGRTATPNSFRIVAAQHPAEFNFTGGSVNSMSILADTGSGEVYVMGVIGD